jgi:signal transduction histidine kinase
MLHSFYAKLSALFLLLIVGLGVIIATLGVRAAQQYADEVEQKLNRTLAEELVPRFEPLLEDRVEYAAIEAEIEDMTGINRRIEIYLLDDDGGLKASFGVPEGSMKRSAVAMEPIRQFMSGEELPILGDDPRDRDGQKPFSVAHIDAMGERDCYLYIILGSEQYASTARMLGDSYIVQTALRGLALVLFTTAGLGLFFFRRLTQRLRAMQDVVSRFERGDFEQRMTVRSSDEIGRLAECFNQMADTLVDTMQELRDADRMRRELVANVSHDLRSPLSSIQGYLETVSIKDGELEPTERRRYVETALRNAQRLNSLVGSLFELSKLETKQIQPEREAFPLAELVQDVVLQYRPRAEAEAVDLQAELPDRRVRAHADIGLMERVLTNLIDNAIHYTPAGGTVRVGMSVTETGGNGAVPDRIRLFVRDTGPGIPEDDVPHVFERFYRVDKSRDRDRGGAGLGLAIAHTIVDLHGETLEVKSDLGRGTTFWFDLPVVDG